MVKRAADELKSEANELMRAARMPHTIRPFTPAGRSFATSVGKAASELTEPLGSMGRKSPRF
jgi:hypothetical protein